MEPEEIKKIQKDNTGLSSYEYIANHVTDLTDEDLEIVTDNIIRADSKGQFAVSTARYLNAIDPNRFQKSIDVLIKHAISTDREHKYIPDLLASIWGEDYEQHVNELNTKDDNFRRIYKRVYSQGL